MTARANIIVNEADGVLMVPANCLRTEGSSRYVQVYNEATVSSPELKEGDKILVKAAKATQTNSNRMGGPPMH